MKDFIEFMVLGDMDRDFVTELIEANTDRLILAIESQQEENSGYVFFSSRTERGSFAGMAATADFMREGGDKLRNAEVTLYVMAFTYGDQPTKPSWKLIRKKQQVTEISKLLFLAIQKLSEDAAQLCDLRQSESVNRSQNVETGQCLESIQCERSSAFLILSCSSNVARCRR
jgi:hypothetical protein